jgi:hypothetical protein
MTSTTTTPTVLSMMVSVSASSPAASTWPCFHRLSPEETADKRKKGECYFFPKKFSLEHKCASKRGFLMELEDDLALLTDELSMCHPSAGQLASISLTSIC